MKRVDRILDWLERWGVGLGFATCLVVLTLGVLARYVFRRPLSWPDELSTYLFILITFLGASASVRDDSELKVNALYEAFAGLRVPLDLFLHLVRIAAAGIMIWTGWNFVKVEWEFDTVSPILGIPIPIVFAILPVFGCLLIMRSGIRLVSLVRGE